MPYIADVGIFSDDGQNVVAGIGIFSDGRSNVGNIVMLHKLTELYLTLKCAI